MAQSARYLIEARLRDDAITVDYHDEGISTEVFEHVRDKGYRVVRLERTVDRSNASLFVCEFENSTRERRYKMVIRTENGRFDIKLDNLNESKSRKLLGDRQHALELLKVYT